MEQDVRDVVKDVNFVQIILLVHSVEIDLC